MHVARREAEGLAVEGEGGGDVVDVEDGVAEFHAGLWGSDASTGTIRQARWRRLEDFRRCSLSATLVQGWILRLRAG